ncbi:MAG TPA: YihY/virulence factor BrkB family protein [Terracidiphilus sp.]|jgi:membrane protein|nr:YihY/virulence factor BrkB family protein [Terracidiphilus sp.]
MGRVLRHLRRTLWLALDHDVFNTAKAAAYSGMLCFFPAVLVFTALLAEVPEGRSLVGEIRGTFDQILPPESMSLLQNSLNARHLRSAQVILSAATLAVFAGLGVMLSLMEGFRRAYKVRRDNWGFWKKRMRALMLVPIVLLPLSLASLLLVFGHQIEDWTIARAGHELRSFVLVAWRLARWAVAVSTGVTVLAALYHFGTKRTEHWGWVLPGALTATLVWFPATLAFGWYVTRVADYTRFYGSFAAGIATLVWLYLTSFSALLGAELNGVLYQARLDRMAINPASDVVPTGQ